MARFSFLHSHPLMAWLKSVAGKCVRIWKSLRILPVRRSGDTASGGHLFNKEHKLHILITVPIGLLLFIGLLKGLDAVETRVQSVSQVSALTERIEFFVTQPRLAAIPVRQMRIAANGFAFDGKCVDGLLIPTLHTTVIYGRVGYGPLSIRVVPIETVAGQFTPSDGARASELEGSLYLETDASCAQGSEKNHAVAPPLSDVPLPLPIWGQAHIGSEFKGVDSADPEPRLLLSGKIKVSARALKISPEFLGMRATLYPVADLDLPVGSRLEAAVPKARGPQPQDEGSSSAEATGKDADFTANWWGTAYVDIEKPALNVELATDTSRLALFRPNEHEPDIIEVSRLNQVFEDPNLIEVYKLLGVFAFAFTLVEWILRALEKEPSTTPGKEAGRK